MSVETGSPAPYDPALAEAGLIVAGFEDRLVGYANADELESDPGWVEVVSFTPPHRRFVPGASPRVEAEPITERELVWRWA